MKLLRSIFRCSRREALEYMSKHYPKLRFEEDDDSDFGKDYLVLGKPKRLGRMEPSYTYRAGELTIGVKTR